MRAGAWVADVDVFRELRGQGLNDGLQESPSVKRQESLVETCAGREIGKIAARPGLLEDLAALLAR